MANWNGPVELFGRNVKSKCMEKQGMDWRNDGLNAVFCVEFVLFYFFTVINL